MTVPDDVTLLWTDDTCVFGLYHALVAVYSFMWFRWGNVRRYPVPSERNRTGGAGVYYHVSLSIALFSLYITLRTHINWLS